MYIIILNYTFELLFDPQGFSLGALLGLKTGLHRVHGPRMVLAVIKRMLTIAGQHVMLTDYSRTPPPSLQSFGQSPVSTGPARVEPSAPKEHDAVL